MDKVGLLRRWERMGSKTQGELGGRTPPPAQEWKRMGAM